MKNELLELEIDEIERTLLRDDPAFAKRLRALDEADNRHDTTVFSLLAASAVLLAVGLATLTPAAWLAGAGAFITSSVLDARHERKLDNQDPLNGNLVRIPARVDAPVKRAAFAGSA